MKKKVIAVLVAVTMSVLSVPGAVFAAPNTATVSGNESQSAEDLLTVHNNKGKKVKPDKADRNNSNGYIFVLKKNTSSKEKKALKETISEDCSKDEAEAIFGDEMYYADSLDTIEEVADLDTVEYIEPDYTLHAMGTVPAEKKDKGVKAKAYTPNDTYYSSNKWAYDQMNISDVWEQGVFGKGTGANETPTVAVVDTGIAGWGQKDRYKHPDINYKNIPYVAKGSGINYYYDDNGHGTFVTGEIAAIMNNGIGTNGLMPEVKIVSSKVLNAKGSVSTSDLISNLDYLNTNNSKFGIDVINMSLGGSGYSSSFQTAINNLAAKGIIIVASAGNDNVTTYNYPASYDNVISVSATNKSGNKSSYSQYNDKVDVAAPGGDSDGYIYGTHPSYVGSTYVGMMGTSMAAPYVSALAAMAKSLDSSMNHDKFMELIESTSTDAGAAGYDTSFGWGIANFGGVYNAITGGDTPEEPEEPEPHTYTVTFNMNGHGSAIASQNIEEGKTAVKPKDPTATGYNFGGWCTDPDCNSAFDFSTPITADTTLYAKWTEVPAKTIDSVTLSSSTSTYTGKAIKPSVTVKSSGTTISSYYYTVTYANNTNVGTATVTVTGKNGYSGSKSASFTILPKGTSVSKLTAANRGFTATWAKQATQTTGYILQYSTSSSFSNPTTIKITNTSTTKHSVTGLSSRTSYYVRIATYKTSGNYDYQSAWSAVKTIKTK